MPDRSKKINETGFIKSLKARLVEDHDYLVVGRKHSIEISLINEDGTLKYERSIEVKEEIIDLEHLKTGAGEYNDWLIVAVKGCILRFIAFRSIKDDFIAEEFPLKFRGKQYNIQPGSLKEDIRHNYFSVYTKQKDLLVFRQVGTDFMGTGAHSNFKKALDPTNKEKLKFFLKPQIYPTKYFAVNSHVDILTWDTTDTDEGDFSYTMIQRNDVGEYSFSNPFMKVKRFETCLSGGWDGILPEPVSPLSLNIPWIGSILFSKTGLYYRLSPYGFSISLEKNSKISENSTVEFGQNNVEGCFAYMRIPNKSWDVIAAIDFDSTNKFLIIESSGDVYMMIFKASACSRSDYNARIKEWTLKKLNGSLPPDIIQVTKITEKSFYATSLALDSFVFTVDDGGEIQKLQKIPSKRHLWNGRELSEILPNWKLFNYGNNIFASSFNDIKLYDSNYRENKAINIKSDVKFTDLLDMKYINGECLILKKQGLMKQDIVLEPLDITHGIILDTGELVVISKNKLVAKGYEVDLKVEPSILQALHTKDGELYVVVGGWNGTVQLFTSKPYQSYREYKLSSPITSAVIVSLANTVVYLVGTDKGEVQIYNDSEEAGQIFIGEGTVDFSNQVGSQVFAYNYLNTVQITFSDEGEILDKAYLDFGPVSALRLNESDKLIALNANQTELKLINPAEYSKYSIV